MPYRTNPDDHIDPKLAKDMLRHAHEAAKERSAAEMLTLLAESGFLDGQVRRIAGMYRSLGLDAAEDAVALAVEQLYSRVMNTEKPLVQKPDAYLTKAAPGFAQNEAQRLKDDRKAAAEHSLVDHPHEGDQPSRDILRQQAIRVARQLVSRLGQQNVRRVMEVVLDAVEQLEPTSPTEIGEVLGLKPNTVSKLIERGITRLARVAKEEGLDLKLDYASAIEEEHHLDDDPSDGEDEED